MGLLLGLVLGVGVLLIVWSFAVPQWSREPTEGRLIRGQS
jgi:hypothetical protein